jgi:DNA-binding winged helix-turn-helix (wHTH) protein
VSFSQFSPSDGVSENMQLRFGAFLLDADSRQLLKNGLPIHLTPKAFELLRLLAENRHRAVSKAELTERLWPGVHVTEDGLPRLVSEIRTALGDSAREPRLVRTVHGFGYAFANADVQSGVSPDGCRLTWASREFRLSDGEHVIGRDPGVSICLEGPAISRQHARIAVTHGQAVIEDLGSKNGTFVGADRLTASHVLQDGETIRVGDFTLTFRATASLPTETRPS